MKFKKNKGVTLVALVVTIIILLILAGVTLNLALNENGIIGRTKNAASGYEQAEENEVIALGELANRIKRRQSINGDGTGGNESQPKVIEASTKNIVKASTNIGKKVNFVSKYSNDLIWRLFYADDDYVYLISSKLNEDGDEIEAQRTNYGGLGGLGLISQESAGYSGAQAVTDPFLRSLNSSWYNVLGNEECDNENAKAVAWLMNQNVWKNWKDEDGLVKYVIGGPTVELLAKSYNATASINETTTMTYSVNGKWGYEVSGANLQNTFNYGIYHLKGGDDAFWLASPGGANESEEWQGKSIRTSGGTYKYGGVYIVYFGANFYNLGVRPVVIIDTDDFVNARFTLTDE